MLFLAFLNFFCFFCFFQRDDSVCFLRSRTVSFFLLQIASVAFRVLSLRGGFWREYLGRRLGRPTNSRWIGVEWV